jgi:hypothetical protein
MSAATATLAPSWADAALADLGLDLGIEELDEITAPTWDWGAFFEGVGVGIALVGVYAAGAALVT